MRKSAAPNAIDVNAHGLIGAPIDRVEGPLKVSGRAPYSYECQADHGAIPACGFIVGSTIAKGSIAKIDTKAAEAVPGVLLVLTHENAPKLKGKKPTTEKSFTDPKPYLQKKQVRYFGEPVAFIVAETFEAARAAGNLINVKYKASSEALFHVGPNIDRAFEPKPSNGQAPDSAVGDFDKAFSQAPVTIDATYTTPYQNHNAIELHTTLAQWDVSGALTVHTANQLPMEAQKALANTFGLKPDQVRVLCKYIGGGFGGKLPVQGDAILTSMAARILKRPVKTAMTRQQTFFNVTHRSETVQRVRLGAEKDGTLTSIGHEVWAQTSTFEEYLEAAAFFTRSLYAAPNRMTKHRLVALDVASAGSMRAPGEASGMLSVEQAMDELAVKLDMDPIELRVRNEPSLDPEKNIPFSTRALVPCMREGAARFGWDKRNQKPGQTRDGNWLVGMGMAAAIRTNYLQPSAARVRLNANGTLRVQCAMTDIGTGSYTILAQIAAEATGLPMDSVIVEMGDTDLPPTAGSGGSWGANSAGSAVYNACVALRDTLAKLAVQDKASPLYGADRKKAALRNGEIVIDGNSESLHTLIARSAPEGIEADGKIKAPETYKTYSQQAFGSFFVEVGVDVDTAEIRIRRMLGVFAAGRILNAKTAHSQLIGGMIWGIGSALMEETIVDKRYGHFVNHDLAEYHVPVHADAVDIEAIILPETDDKTGPLKIKGVGELGICGAGAAVANAVFNATGVRIRDYPLTLDKILKNWT